MAGPSTWVRNFTTLAITSSPADFNFTNIPAGNTILRVHAGVKVMLEVPGGTNYAKQLANQVVAGIYTRLTVGGTLLNPATQPSDFNPPQQRWLWWELLTPRPVTAVGSSPPDIGQLWVYEPAQVPIDIEAAVKSVNGISLDVAVGYNDLPGSSLVFNLYAWASILYRPT